MTRAGLPALACGCALAVASSAQADEATPAGPAATLLPGAARAIPRTTSASRDTPVLELAYGPRAQASIGAEPGLLEVQRARTTLRLGLYAMVGLENATSGRAFPPGELWRGLVGASFALDLPRIAHAWLLPGSDMEIALVVGHESDHATAASSSTLAPPGPYAIPFGGGGDFIEPDIAVRLPAGPAVTLTLRLRDRIYFNALPLLVGARSVSDDVADGLHEGLVNAPAADLVVRWNASRWAMPQLALFGEHLFPHDPSVPDGQFFRAVAGVVLPGRAGEIEPFASFDGGNGKGLLVQERALRLSVGVRYAPF
jgi:hypothetical protein